MSNVCRPGTGIGSPSLDPGQVRWGVGGLHGSKLESVRYLLCKSYFIQSSQQHHEVDPVPISQRRRLRSSSWERTGSGFPASKWQNQKQDLALAPGHILFPLCHESDVAQSLPPTFQRGKQYDPRSQRTHSPREHSIWSHRVGFESWPSPSSLCNSMSFGLFCERSVNKSRCLPELL